MAKTPEQVLREIVAEQIFQIAALLSKIDALTEENQKLSPTTKKRKKDAVKPTI